MKNKLTFLCIIFIIISLYKCGLENSEEELDDDMYDPSKMVLSFKESLKEYLISHNLLESDELIEREEMKKIFLEIILDEDHEEIPDYMQGVFEYLTKHFMDKYYKKKKNEIRGRDIYDLIDILEISSKFQQLTGNPDYDDFEYNEEEVGFMDEESIEPNSGL